MKKTNLIIITKISEANLANDIKKEIISFLGKRMISDTLDGYPGLIINDILSDDDKNVITSIVSDISEGITILLIESSSEEEKLVIDKYLITIDSIKY